MSGSQTVVPFSDAEKIAILRYCGYPSYGWLVDYDPFALYFAAYDQPTPVYPGRMIAVLAAARAKMTELDQLDQAIVGASSNLDTDSAAVWKHNKNEVADRLGLYRNRCRDLCGLLGVDPGPALTSSSQIRLIV